MGNEAKPVKKSPFGLREDVDPAAVAAAEKNLTGPFAGGSQLAEDKTGAIYVQSQPGQSRVEAKAEGEVEESGKEAAERLATEGGYSFNEPPPTAGGGGAGESQDEMMAGLIAGQTAKDKLLNTQLHSGARGPQDVVQAEGENYLPFGGVEGKQRFNRAYDATPLGKIFDDSARAQSDRAKELEAHYTKQTADETKRMAAIQARRKEDAQQIEFQQKQLETKTRQYTDDLANQGKFWENPGNIISAISFSLMPIFSNDPAIGAKLINQAIDRDMANRRNLADMHLGELRSNIGTYRKIAEDRQAGDMMAQAEAHYVAGLDIQRIMQKFQSPISLAQGQAAYQDQMMRMEQARGQAFARIHNDPRRLDPRIAKGFATGVEGAWSPYGTTVAPTIPAGSPGSAVQGSYAGTASTASSTGKSLSTKDSAILSNPEQTVLAVLNGRIPQGYDAGTFLQMSIDRQAKALTGYRNDEDTPSKGEAFEAKKKEIVEKAEAQIDPATSALLVKNSQERNGVQRLQRDLDIIARSPKGPEMVNGSLRRNLTPEKMNAWYNSIRLKMQDDPKNPAVAREQETFQAAARLHQLFMSGVSDYYHAKAGANQSPSEEGRLSQVIKSDSSFQEMVSFTQLRSQALQSEVFASVGHLSPAALYLYMQKPGVNIVSGRLNTPNVPAPIHHMVETPENTAGTGTRSPDLTPEEELALPANQHSNRGR